MNKVAITAVLAALALAGALAGCPGNTHCDYVAPTPPSGDLLRDIHGCWQSVGNGALDQDPYNLVAYQFTGIAESFPDGGVVVYQWREVQPPNNVYPGGMIFRYVYDLGQTNDAGFTELDLHAAPYYPPAVERVTDTTLQLFFFPPGYASYLQPLRRAVCTGFGFDSPPENPPEPCPKGLANP